MILVAGEALIDMLPTADGRPDTFRAVPGGSPFNVALALGRLGAPVQFLCPFSNDAFGRRLFGTLRESGVDLTLAPRTEALSTLGFVTLDEGTKTARYSFYTEGTAGCGMRESELPEALPPQLKCLHLGSFSLAVEPFCTTAERLLARLGPGTILSLDPNIRPRLVARAVDYPARLERLLRRAAIVKASLEDLEWLRPGRPPGEFAAELLEGAARLVVVTVGGQGALAFSRTVRIEVPAVPVEVVDTVGAGDTFQAAFLAWLAARQSLSAAALETLPPPDFAHLLDYASRAAAITCTRAGCDPPWARELV